MREPNESIVHENPSPALESQSSADPSEDQYLILDEILKALPIEDRIHYWEAFNKLFSSKTAKMPFFVVLLDEEFTFEFARSGSRNGKQKVDNFAILDAEPFRQWQQQVLEEIAYNKKTPKQRAAVSRESLKTINKDKVAQELANYLKTLQPALK